MSDVVTYSRGRPYVVRLPGSVVDKIRTLLESPGSTYRDLGEFLTVAAENLLALEAFDDASFRLPNGRPGVQTHTGPRDGVESAPSSLVSAPHTRPPTKVARFGEEPFFVLTNRLNPMVPALRVLANLTLRGGPPKLGHFTTEAGRCGRNLGLELKARDRREGLKGLDRRSVGWPIGADEHKAIERYLWSFVLTDRPGHSGPLADIGFLAMDDGVPYLTDLGLDVAMAPSPLLGECEGSTLSEAQQQAMRSALLRMPGEIREIQAFLRAVEAADGVQERVDAALRETHDSWTPNRATAQRAAMIGRLRDVGVLDVEGRGPLARLKILGCARDFA